MYRIKFHDKVCVNKLIGIVKLFFLIYKHIHFSLFENIFVFLDKGYNLEFKVLSHEKIKLTEYGEYLYDQMILFCTADSGKYKNIFKLLGSFRSYLE